MPADTTISSGSPAAAVPPTGRPALREPLWLRACLIGGALTFLAVFLLLPLILVFVQALAHGIGAYWDALVEADALSAIQLTVLVAAIAVPLNLVFGIAASWCIAKFEFRGKSLLVPRIALPFSVSPVISGMVYVLLFGLNGWLGPWVIHQNIQELFTQQGVGREDS